MTFGRLTHVNGEFTFTVFTGSLQHRPHELAEKTCAQWPHLFARVDCDPYRLIQEYANNHIHAVSGDYVEEVRMFCELSGVTFKHIT